MLFTAKEGWRMAASKIATGCLCRKFSAQQVSTSQNKTKKKGK
jgi:hypothetical protein